MPGCIVGWRVRAARARSALTPAARAARVAKRRGRATHDARAGSRRAGDLRARDRLARRPRRGEPRRAGPRSLAPRSRRRRGHRFPQARRSALPADASRRLHAPYFLPRAARRGRTPRGASLRAARAAARLRRGRGRHRGLARRAADRRPAAIGCSAVACCSRQARDGRGAARAPTRSRASDPLHRAARTGARCSSRSSAACRRARASGCSLLDVDDFKGINTAVGASRRRPRLVAGWPDRLRARARRVGDVPGAARRRRVRAARAGRRRRRHGGARSRRGCSSGMPPGQHACGSAPAAVIGPAGRRASCCSEADDGARRGQARRQGPRAQLRVVADGRQVEAVRRRGVAGRGARRAVEQRARSRRAGPAATSSIVPTSTRFMWRMNASASIQNSRMSPSRSQLRAVDVAREAPCGRSRSGVNAVKSCVPCSAAAQACSAVVVERCGHHSARPRSNGDGVRRASTR